jgi:hypothetical protein
MSKFLKAVYGQVVIALDLGLAIGTLFPETAKPRPERERHH